MRGVRGGLSRNIHLNNIGRYKDIYVCVYSIQFNAIYTYRFVEMEFAGIIFTDERNKKEYILHH